jgi:hypothetical protein
MSDGARLKAAIEGFDQASAFGEEEYSALKRAVAGVGRVDSALLDGFVGLFFERHLLDDARRAELLAMSPDELLRAVRHRFKQVVAGEGDAHQAWHALAAHVRDALRSLQGPSRAGFPVGITGTSGFSSVAVEEAVGAVWGELGRRPTVPEATAELFSRYVRGTLADHPPGTTGSREFPAVLGARLDAQRLARGMLEVLSAEERRLLRSQLDGESVDAWAQANGVSRATAYRMLARVKALCRISFDDRTRHTQLAVLDALRGQL